MDKDLSLEDVLAQSLINYNTSKKVSIQCQDHDITDFCNKRIVSYCSCVEKNGKSGVVIQKLEEMKATEPKNFTP